YVPTRRSSDLHIITGPPRTERTRPAEDELRPRRPLTIPREQVQMALTRACRVDPFTRVISLTSQWRLCSQQKIESGPTFRARISSVLGLERQFPHLQPMPALRRRVRHEPTGATPLEQVRHPHFLAAKLVRTVRENMDRQVELAMIHRLPDIGFTHLSGGSLEQGSHFDRPQTVRPVTEPYALTACLRAARQVQDRPGRGDVADDRLPRGEKTGHDLHPPTSDVERVRRRASRDAARMASASLRASIFSMTTKGPPPFCARSDTRSV